MVEEKTILVIGKNGQLAHELSEFSNFNIKCLGRADIDVLSCSSIEAAIKKYEPLSIINTCAYTAVDKAEVEVEKATMLNSDAVANLASSCNKLNLHLVHVSTDYVFCGTRGEPYKTDHPLQPQSVYGRTKAEGERKVLDTLPEHACIIRTSWLYSRFGHNFIKTMLKMMATKQQVTVVDDQIGSPTWAGGLARACLDASLIQLKGVYHWTDEGVCSWYDLALTLRTMAIELGLLNDDAAAVVPINSTQFVRPAKRPNYSVLDKSDTRAAFKTKTLVHWQLNLRKMLAQLANQQHGNSE